MFKICGEPDRPHEGACLRHIVSRNREMRGMFSIYDEPESPNDRGMSKIYDEPESPSEGACLRHIMSRCSRYRQMRGRV